MPRPAGSLMRASNRPYVKLLLALRGDARGGVLASLERLACAP